MKKTTILMLAAASLFAACNNESNETKTSKTDSITKPDVTTMDPARSCYASFANGDTVQLKVEKFPNTVVGMLDYRLKEKDSNKGTYEGTMRGDTLIADYRFISEGTESVRQVAFLVQDGKAIEGYGEMEEKDGKMVFKEGATITYGKGIVLGKKECDY